ncbi:hypothetical protein [Streptomyces lydicus]|uniref:hypothetical protein n=1 Tax=Streptomyces lydicus TaxID=47763 RepID=UPI00378F79EE
MSGHPAARWDGGTPQGFPPGRIVAPEVAGPEDVVATADGSVLAGAADGTICWSTSRPDSCCACGRTAAAKSCCRSCSSPTGWRPRRTARSSSWPRPGRAG